MFKTRTNLASAILVYAAIFATGYTFSSSYVARALADGNPNEPHSSYMIQDSSASSQAITSADGGQKTLVAPAARQVETPEKISSRAPVTVDSSAVLPPARPAASYRPVNPPVFSGGCVAQACPPQQSRGADCVCRWDYNIDLKAYLASGEAYCRLSACPLGQARDSECNCRPQSEVMPVACPAAKSCKVGDVLDADCVCKKAPLVIQQGASANPAQPTPSLAGVIGQQVGATAQNIVNNLATNAGNSLLGNNGASQGGISTPLGAAAGCSGNLPPCLDNQSPRDPSGACLCR